MRQSLRVWAVAESLWQRANQIRRYRCRFGHEPRRNWLIPSLTLALVAAPLAASSARDANLLPSSDMPPARTRTAAAKPTPDGKKAARPRITLRVYNYARVPSPILVNAEQEASNIFRRAGVETTWLDCRLSIAEARTPACDRPFGPGDLFLRLLSPTMARPLATNGDVCGVALAAKDRRGTDAYVFYGGVMDLANTGYIHKEEILAAITAHEIGHLLLGPGHSPSGIMSAKWTREDLATIHVGFLLFTPNQSALMRSQILARMASR